MTTLPLALALLGCGAGTEAPSAAAPSFTMIYSSRLEGEIEPCG